MMMGGLPLLIAAAILQNFVYVDGSCTRLPFNYYNRADVTMPLDEAKLSKKLLCFELCDIDLRCSKSIRQSWANGAN